MGSRRKFSQDTYTQSQETATELLIFGFEMHLQILKKRFFHFPLQLKLNIHEWIKIE